MKRKQFALLNLPSSLINLIDCCDENISQCSGLSDIIGTNPKILKNKCKIEINLTSIIKSIIGLAFKVDLVFLNDPGTSEISLTFGSLVKIHDYNGKMENSKRTCTPATPSEYFQFRQQTLMIQSVFQQPNTASISQSLQIEKICGSDEGFLIINEINITSYTCSPNNTKADCTCQDGFYHDTNSSECLSCHFFCDTCSGPTSSSCSKGKPDLSDCK